MEVENNNYLQLLCREIMEFLLFYFTGGFRDPLAKLVKGTRGEVKFLISQIEKVVVHNFIVFWNNQWTMVKKNTIFQWKIRENI